MRKKIIFIIFIILLICTAMGINYFSIAAGENWSVGSEHSPGLTAERQFRERAKEAFDSKDQEQTFFKFDVLPWLRRERVIQEVPDGIGAVYQFGEYCIDPHTGAKAMLGDRLYVQSIIDLYPDKDRLEVWDGGTEYAYDVNFAPAEYQAALPIIKAMAYAAEKSATLGEVGNTIDKVHWKWVIQTLIEKYDKAELGAVHLNAAFQYDVPYAESYLKASIDEAMNGSKGKSYRARFIFLYGEDTQNKLIFCAFEAPKENQLIISKLGLAYGESEANGTKLPNVGFTLQCLQEGEHNGHYVNIDENGNAVFSIEPITLRTNGQGQIEIKNLPNGKYVLVETDLPYEEYKPSAPIEINYGGGSQTVTVKNYGGEPTSSAGGYVWEDNPSGKTKTRNDLRSYGADDNADKDLSNVKVTIYHENGSVLGSTSTSGGNYSFGWQIGERDLKKYYDGKKGYRVEFEYNGLTYEAVSPNPKHPKGSEAYEDGGGRAKINSNFNTIEHNRTRNRSLIKL